MPHRRGGTRLYLAIAFCCLTTIRSTTRSPRCIWDLLLGRSPDLSTVLDGYFLNSMSYQTEANRIPLLTLADYLWNPRQYDPARSIGQAVMHLGDTPAKREALRELVELYPGRLWDKSKSTAWNSLRVRFDRLLQHGQKSQARKLTEKAQATLQRMKATSPDAWASGEKILEDDVAAMSRQLEASHL